MCNNVTEWRSDKINILENLSSLTNSTLKDSKLNNDLYGIFGDHYSDADEWLANRTMGISGSFANQDVLSLVAIQRVGSEPKTTIIYDVYRGEKYKAFCNNTARFIRPYGDRYKQVRTDARKGARLEGVVLSLLRKHKSLTEHGR